MKNKCRHILIVPEITFKTDKTNRVKKCPKCKKYFLDKRCNCPPGYHQIFTECRGY